ncbi:hypothetical protein E2P71_04795 [Candidatus Bathyarchaeota archaeon]|nr:hypothetical protein E2P71_04795 [Candidatus Bathyarchaeota archaeon]
MGTCKVCARDVAGDSAYCRQHLQAYNNLEKAYEQWRYALGLSWAEYLEKVTKAPGTGQWAREVAADILGGP